MSAITAVPIFARRHERPGLGLYRSRFRGFAAAAHHHPEPQLILPLDGRLHLVAGERAHVLGPHGAVWLPADVVHGFTHLDGQVDYVVVECLPPPGSALAAATRPLLARSPALWHLAQALAHGLEAPGPLLEALVAPLLLAVEGALAQAPMGSPEVRRVVEAVLAGYGEDLRVPDLAALVGLSARQLERRFQQELGRSPKRFLTEVRLGAAERLLAETGRSVAEIALAVGFANPSHFAATFKAFTGKHPHGVR